VEGGAVVPLGDPGRFVGGAWAEDGNIVIGVLGKGLLRIRDGGGSSMSQPETLAPLANGEALLGFPQLLIKKSHGRVADRNH
jgi:hypothetical protein